LPAVAVQVHRERQFEIRCKQILGYESQPAQMVAFGAGLKQQQRFAAPGNGGFHCSLVAFNCASLARAYRKNV
jgi:hypothetical protein